MNIAVLGGSAPSTPALALALARSQARPVTLRLAGRDAQHLAGITRACRILCDGTGVSVAPYHADRWRDAIDGADIAIIQVRQGGYAGRAFDERFPLIAGVPGDEGLGPGGLSAAYRGWPVLRRWLAEIQHQAPNCRVMMVTSPGGLLVALARAEFPALTVVHPCELPLVTLQALCASCSVSWEDATFEYVGHNHMGWFLRLESGGTDVLAHHVSSGASTFPSSSLVAEEGGFPLKYLRMHYARPDVLREQATVRRTRGEELVGIARRAHPAFARGDRSTIEAALSTRPSPWHLHAVVPLIQAWMGRSVEVPLFLTSSEGTAQMQERHCVVRHGAITAMPLRSLVPPAIQSFMDRITFYETLAAAAIQNRSEPELARALQEHPWVSGRAAARRLAGMVYRQEMMVVRRRSLRVA